MTTRLLPPDEWPRLVGTELETVWPHADPSVMQIVVVEDGEQIVGCWSVFPVVHVEGLWIHPAYRQRASVGRRLWRGMLEQISALGASAVMTSAVTEDIRRLLQTAQARVLPGETYVMTMRKGRTVCQPQ